MMGTMFEDIAIIVFFLLMALWGAVRFYTQVVGPWSIRCGGA